MDKLQFSGLFLGLFLSVQALASGPSMENLFKAIGDAGTTANHELFLTRVAFLVKWGVLKSPELVEFFNDFKSGEWFSVQLSKPLNQ